MRTLLVTQLVAAVGMGLLAGSQGIGAEHPKLVGHTGEVTAVAFSPDATKLLTGGADRTVRLWDAVTGKELKTFTGHNHPVAEVMFSPDGKYVASQDARDQSWNLWNTETGARHGPLPGSHWGGSFTPDSKRFVATTYQGEGTTRQRWDTATGQLLPPMRPVEVALPSDVFQGSRSVLPEAFAYSPDGKRMAIVGETRVQSPTMFEAFPFLAIRDRQTCKVVRHRSIPRRNSGDVLYSPDGKKLLVNTRDPRGDVTHIYDPETLNELSQVPAWALDVVSDNKHLIGRGADGNLGLYDLDTGKRVAPLPGTVAAASPKAPVLAVGGKDGVALMDLDTVLAGR